MTPVQAPSYHVGFWKLDPERDYKEYLPELKLYLKYYERQRFVRRVKSCFIKHKTRR